MLKLVIAAHRCDEVCEVMSAKPLDNSQNLALKSALKKFLQPTENTKLTSKVNPAIIDSTVVSVSDKYVDFTVARKMNKFQDLISGTVLGSHVLGATCYSMKKNSQTLQEATEPD